MKKLNKKGFTLVELLAVIVILAVIMVITIPTVLGSMDKAKESAFATAVETMEEFIQKEYDYKQLGTIGGYTNKLTSFPTTAATATTLDVTLAGYTTSDVGTVKYYIDNGKAKVVCAIAASGSSNFKQGSVPKEATISGTTVKCTS